MTERNDERETVPGFSIEGSQSQIEVRKSKIVRTNSSFRAAAILFSFIATCERHQLNPWQYLRDVLSRIAAIPTSRLAELLPDR